MYVTRSLTVYRKDPSVLSLFPPEGPNSGVLVVQDEEQKDEDICCFGSVKRERIIRNLPFPQNKDLLILTNHVLFIPVLNQPLSSNLYYILVTNGVHQGKAYTNSKEKDRKEGCFCSCFPDLDPQPLDPRNIYQQFEIRGKNGHFSAKSVASDGIPPCFLIGGWKVLHSTPSESIRLREAQGIDRSLRARLPDFSFSLSEKCSPPVVVGGWYCPFMFVKDGELKDEVRSSIYYEMTLEQQWEQVFSCESNGATTCNFMDVDVGLESEVIRVGRKQVVVTEKDVSNGVMWFSSFQGGGGARVGLSMVIVERMKWEQERFGWSGDERKKEVRVEEFEEWKRLVCYILVERFVMKRMDGSMVLTYEFRHPNKVRSKWE